MSLGAKLASAFGLTLVLMIVAAVLAVTKMDALSDRTADAKRGAVLDEQIMSMEIAVREALDAEAGAIISGDSPELDERLERAWNSNDGDAFAESLAEARRLAVLDMPQRLEADEAAGEKIEESVARTVELVREGDLRGRARQPPDGHAAGVRGLPREEPGRRGAVGGVQRGGVRRRRDHRHRRQAPDHHRRDRGPAARGQRAPS